MVCNFASPTRVCLRAAGAAALKVLRIFSIRLQADVVGGQIEVCSYSRPIVKWVRLTDLLRDFAGSSGDTWLSELPCQHRLADTR
jgi:hypothetical protein